LKNLLGFPGPGGWINDRFRLDHDYYRGLVRLGWGNRQQNNNDLPGIPNQNFWDRRGQNIILINADVAVVNNFAGRIDGNGRVNCRFRTRSDQNGRCPFATMTRQFAINFDNDNSRWLDVFEPAFQKMITNGYDASGVCSEPPCRLP